MSHLNKTLLFFGLLVVAQGANTGRGETLVQWKFTPGKSLRYGFQQQTQTETRGAGKPTTATVTMGMQLSWRVEDVDAQGIAAVAQTIDQFSLSMKVDNLAPIEYDSAARSPVTGPAKEIGDKVAKLIGARASVRLNGRGEVVGFELPPELAEALGKEKSGGVPAAESLEQVVKQTSLVLPEAAVEPESSWEAALVHASPLGQLKQMNRYTYVGPVERDGAMLEEIKLESTLSLDKSKQGSAPDVNLKESAQGGTLLFDATGGHLVSSEIKQRLVTERPYRETIIRVQTTSTSTIRLLPMAGE